MSPNNSKEIKLIERKYDFK